MKGTPLKQLKNLGPTIVSRLHDIGIFTKEDLARVGPVSAYVHMQNRDPKKHLPVCYYLYSLEGALKGVHWDKISKKKKGELLRQVKSA